MKLSILFVSIRSVTVQLEDGGLYNTVRPYRLILNGCDAGEMTRVVTTLFGLLPDTDYTLAVMDGEEVLGEASFRTAHEVATLNVRRFGAIGDGVHDDTPAIQAAINCCPADGRVLIPAGTYSVLPLFLKSHVRVEIAKNAQLKLNTDRSLFPILPGLIQTTDETGEINYGSWEGNPLDMFGSLITGVDIEDAVVYGEGVIDGQGDVGDWWVNHRERRLAWRGRMVFLNHCRNVTLQGITVRNSPCWNLHPYFSDDLKFLSLSIQAPAVSPNTDGFDPESCRRMLMAGTHFSLGDDCIAIKSGKIYMGAKYKQPCEDLEISHCLMENGHGGVTAGSEMAGGVRRVRVHDCLMRNTDRGLRVKARRGRGVDGVIDEIVFDNVRMENVGTPFVINELYYCDPDGKSEYVQSREKQPVDERTPRVGRVEFRNVHATGVACAGYFLGLPEKPIEQVVMEHVTIACSPDAKPMEPAMACGVEVCSQRGIVAHYVDSIQMNDVTISGQIGDELTCVDVGEVARH